MKFLRALKSAGFSFYVACNMLLCATLFFGLSKPRETISGFVGRQFMHLATRTEEFTGVKKHLYHAAAYVLYGLARAIDWLFGDPGHCGAVAVAEDNMRSELYPEDEPQVAPVPPGVDDAALAAKLDRERAMVTERIRQ